MDFVYHHRTQGRGGEGVHIASLVRALEAGGHDVVVVSPPGVDPLRTAGSTPVDKADAPVAGIQRVWRWVSRHSPQVLFEVLELGYNLPAAWRLRPVLRARPGAVYYERYAFFLLAGVWLARHRGMRVILEVNELAGIPRARRQVMVPLASWIERQVLRRADAVLCVSSFLAEEARRRGASPQAVRVVPNAIDPRAFGRDDGAGRVRAALGLGEAVVVGFVGWFDAWDRLDLLVDVVRDLRPELPALRLLLVGDGPVAAALREQVRRDGLEDVVILTGPVPRHEVPQYIGAMDIGVLPSSNRFGSPIVLFELMGMGKAVVAPDLPPIRDVVDDGVTGLIVAAGDAPALREAVRRLAGEEPLRRALGERARERVLTRHTWEANADTVAAVARSAGGRAS